MLMPEPSLTNNGYHVYGWMVDELQLRGLELQLYAIINSYGASGTPVGGIAFFSAWTGYSDKPITKALANLCEQGYIRPVSRESSNGSKGYTIARSFNCLECPMSDRSFDPSDRSFDPSDRSFDPSDRSFDGSRIGESPNITRYITRYNNNNRAELNNNNPACVRVTLEEVVSFATNSPDILKHRIMRHELHTIAQAYIDKREACGWKLRNGLPIANWKADFKFFIAAWCRNTAKLGQSSNGSGQLNKNIY